MDDDGNTALHHAASRGDNEMIQYLVSVGADVTKVNRAGLTTVDMANGPVQRTQPYPGNHQAARESRRQEQPQVRLLLRKGHREAKVQAKGRRQQAKGEREDD